MKKYKDLYEEEKQRHEEALQRYQEDHMDEMEIINLHKKCNKKTRKAPQPKKALSKSDEPKKVSGPTEEGRGSKRASSDGKKSATKAGKKLKRPQSLKKNQKHLNLLIQERKKKNGRLRTIEGGKFLLCYG